MGGGKGGGKKEKTERSNDNLDDDLDGYFKAKKETGKASERWRCKSALSVRGCPPRHLVSHYSNRQRHQAQPHGNQLQRQLWSLRPALPVNENVGIGCRACMRVICVWRSWLVS